MTVAEQDRIEQLQTQLRTAKQVLKQTDEAASAIRDGWDAEDVTAKRDECRTRIGQIEAELAEIEGREYVAPEKVGDADHVRVGDAEGFLYEMSEMVSELYEMIGGE